VTEEGALEKGDTIAWKSLRSKSRSWGLVEWVDERGIHVRLAQAGTSKVRTTVNPDYVQLSFHGREEFDKRLR